MDQLVQFIGGGVLPIFAIVVVVVLIVRFVHRQSLQGRGGERGPLIGGPVRRPDVSRGLKVVRGGGISCCR